MNAERLAELRKNLDSETYTSYLPKTVRELLDHIAQLEARQSQRAAERLPKDGDELQALLNKAYRKGNDDAHAAHAVMDATQLEAQRGGAVVVAVEAKDMLSGDLELCFRYRKDEPSALDTVETSVAISDWWFANIRACQIPASQVLQPGMVGVDAGVLEFLGIFFDQRLSVKWEPGKVGYDDLNRWAKESRKAVEGYRAQQAKGE